MGPERMQYVDHQLASLTWLSVLPPLGSSGVKARKIGWSHESSSPDKFRVYRAGGTGIEPATCGCGDPIRRVGWCRIPSPDAALPHSPCPLMSPTVAVCRRSLGQIVGHHKAIGHSNFAWMPIRGAGQRDMRAPIGPDRRELKHLSRFEHTTRFLPCHGDSVRVAVAEVHDRDQRHPPLLQPLARNPHRTRVDHVRQ
jgi:hypothetical protein